MQTSTLSTKFQICIPKAIREQMHLEAGQEFLFIPKGNAIYLVPRLTIQNIKGILPKANTTKVRDRDDRV